MKVKLFLFFSFFSFFSFILADSPKSSNASLEIEAARVSRPGPFIRRWLTLGPIVEGEVAPRAISIDYLFSASGVSEAKFATLEGAPKPGDLVVFKPQGYLAQPRSWQVMELPENHDIDSMLIKEGSVDFAVVYLMTFIESKAAS